ncbi:hypothetical protein ACFRR7_31120 [Streptomyces sp. NPDC056909]|uniref:hypothetical protein n=1 Tax=Streptomyces sp. NPDC056909 TaxID=3345963 RepID=UPI00369494D8
MNAHHITRLLSAGLLIAVLAMGAALDWPIWVWFLLPSLCAGALLIDMWVPRSEGEPSAEPSEPDEAALEPPAESLYQETSVVVVPVVSAVADCPFLFSATVWWRLTDEGASWSHGNPAALASTSVLRRAQRMTSTEHPNRCTFLEHSMESGLGMPAPDDEGLVVAFATDVRLVLRQEDREHLDELDGLRKAVGTWESRRQHERNVREYLGDDVLQSPGSAVVWWMARHDDQIERAVEMIAPLTVLSAAANDEEIPEEYRDLFKARGGWTEDGPTGGFDHPEPIGEETPPGGDSSRPTAEHQPWTSDHLSGWMASVGIDEGSVEGAAFLHRLAQISDAAGRPEAAENIRRKVRGEGREGGASATGPFEDGPPDPPSAAGSAHMPSPSEGAPDGYRSNGARPSRAESWQVTPEGVVSEVDETYWSGPDGPGQDDPGPDREGDER